MSIDIDRSNGAPASPHVLVDVVEECRYRRRLAGVDVCWATCQVSIVTPGDCARCQVPAALDRVDCYYLRASIDALPRPKLSWICGAIGEPVNHRIPSDCSYCDTCERSIPRRPMLEREC